MSELTSYYYYEDRVITPATHQYRVYHADDADKVIAELKETLKNSRNARKYWRKEYLFEYNECCHQKYKRCLAMAMWCRECSWSKCVEKVDFYYKWYNRWLEIAEQFKEEK